MHINHNQNIYFSDTLISDVFLGEYLPELSPEASKVYLYLIYLSKHEKNISSKSDLSGLLNLDESDLKVAMDELKLKLLIREENKHITINDIKQIEFRKHYRRIEQTAIEDIDIHTTKHKERNKVQNAINEMFFNGIMSPSWYTKIDHLFESYQFDDDVMLQLFQQCHQNHALNQNYVETVAKSWADAKIKTNFDLEKYMISRERLFQLASFISKKMKFMRMLTDYELNYIDKWINTYHYSDDVIKHALTKTTSTSKPSMKYLDTIISNWYNNGYRSTDDIEKNQQADKKSYASNSKSKATFDQRNYKKDDIESYYFDPTKNVKKESANEK